MKKIAFVLGNISLGAGTERAVTNLANAFSRDENNQVFIVSINSEDKDKPYYPLEKGIKVIHMNAGKGSKIQRLLGYYGIVGQLNKIMADNDIDYVLGTTHAFNILLSFLKGKVRKIGCEHMSYNACPKVSQIIRKNRYKHLDAVVLLTQMDREHYDFLPSEKTFVIPNIRSFQPDKPAVLDNKRIITVGRLDSQKGYDILVELAPDLKERIPDWKIDIYGSGTMKQQLEDRIKELGIQDFVFINEPVKEIREEFEKSSMYLMTSRFEGLPMVLLEAQACGLPIVSFNCPEGPADVINDGEDGYLIDDFNKEELVEKTARIALDEQLRKKMGANAFKRSDRFSEESILKKWYSCFEKC